MIPLIIMITLLPHQNDPINQHRNLADYRRCLLYSLKDWLSWPYCLTVSASLTHLTCPHYYLYWLTVMIVSVHRSHPTGTDAIMLLCCFSLFTHCRGHTDSSSWSCRLVIEIFSNSRLCRVISPSRTHFIHGLALQTLCLIVAAIRVFVTEILVSSQRDPIYSPLWSD